LTVGQRLGEDLGDLGLKVVGRRTVERMVSKQICIDPYI
jgi:hypothetical protein